MPDPAADDLAWTLVGQSNEWTDDRPRRVTIGARRIAVVRHQGRWYALKDACPHAGVAFSNGYVADGGITCPAHGWRFDLATGAGTTVPGCDTPCYPVREVEGRVEIGV
jgi:nitrite reductase/ring-hydroxylating ferredoxin subunit